ncbi:ATP-binding cassette domain-containing protein [Sporichthya sp.]|uniref:ATP-binding cassette domain-containing protein n=1 Tax=Sporichthya sp. TaxID=65475 RepID=UPI001839D343|nr:ATP-binding cassette domain-containing protein [Sporichthya sp.]MBA3743423.1 ATP-binding cassette domain-containing protein [Sporichthya sp.]
MDRLEIKDLVVEFPSGDYLVRPLDHFNAEALSGELVLLLGPSGCGKTTLLSCLSGILTPTSGEILLDGMSVTGLGPKELTEYRRRSVGLVFQGFKLVPSLTARENVEAPLRMAGVPGKAARARAEELLTRFGLGERMNHRPGMMSGGQQQRAAIARSLAHDPPMIIADEPTASLDYVQVETVIRTLRDLASPGRAVIVSTHDHRLVPLADRVIKMGPQSLGGAKPGPVELTAGQNLFEQGDLGELVYVVAQGEIDLFRRLAEGAEAHIHTCRRGEYFGELAPLLGFPRSSTARAKTDAVVNGITVQEFREKAGTDGVRQAMSSPLPR